MPLMTDGGLTPQEIRKLVSSGVLVPIDHAKRWMASHGMNNESPPTYNQAAQNAGFALNPALAFAQPQQRRQVVPSSQNVSIDMGGRGQLPQEILAMAKARGVDTSRFQNPANEPPRTGQPNVPRVPAGTPPAPITPIPVQPPRSVPTGSYPQLPPVQPPAPYQPPPPLVPPSQQQNPWWQQNIQQTGYNPFGSPSSPPPGRTAQTPNGEWATTNGGGVPAGYNPFGGSDIGRGPLAPSPKPRVPVPATRPNQPMQLPKNFVVSDAMKKAAIAGLIR
jgi:hypothetical protein